MMIETALNRHPDISIHPQARTSLSGGNLIQTPSLSLPSINDNDDDDNE